MNDLDTLFPEKKFSISEQHGLNELSPEDKIIFAPGVSTGGIAEMKMVQGYPERKVIGTTVDERGLKYAQELVDKYKCSTQVLLKLEDVSKALPYDDNYFDFIYARLVLHYLSKKELDSALKELYRALKVNKKLFIVVRSAKNDEVNWPDSKYDDETGFTYVTYTNQGNGSKNIAHRYFHTVESITKHLENAGFKITKVEEYDEQLYSDFERKIKSPKLDQVIEVVAVK